MGSAGASGEEEPPSARPGGGEAVSLPKGRGRLGERRAGTGDSGDSGFPSKNEDNEKNVRERQGPAGQRPSRSAGGRGSGWRYRPGPPGVHTPPPGGTAAPHTPRPAGGRFAAPEPRGGDTDRGRCPLPPPSPDPALPEEEAPRGRARLSRARWRLPATRRTEAEVDAGRGGAGSDARERRGWGGARETRMRRVCVCGGEGGSPLAARRSRRWQPMEGGGLRAASPYGGCVTL